MSYKFRAAGPARESNSSGPGPLWAGLIPGAYPSLWFWLCRCREKLAGNRGGIAGNPGDCGFAGGGCQGLHLGAGR